MWEKCVFAISILLIAPRLFAQADLESEVRKASDKFLMAEFNGDKYYRADFGLFSKQSSLQAKYKMLSQEHRNDAFYGAFSVNWLRDGISVIDSYKISKIKMIGSTEATVMVDFLQIGRRLVEGKDQFVTKNVNKNDSIEIKFKLIKSNWLIYDPPVPRIGKMALLGIYKKELEKAIKVANRRKKDMPNLGIESEHADEQWVEISKLALRAVESL